MALRANCPSCRMPAEFPDGAGGRQVNCPICRAPFMLGANAFGRPQAASSGGGGAGWIVALVVGLGLLLFCGIGVAGAGLFWLRSSARAKPVAGPPAFPAFQQPQQFGQPAFVPATPMPPEAMGSAAPASLAPPIDRSTPSTGKASAAQATAELSNGRYNAANGKLLFSVDYNFPGGAPSAASNLRLAVTGGDGRQFDLSLIGRLEQQGTWQGEALVFGAIAGPFQARLESGSPFNRQPASQTIDLTEDSTLKPFDPFAESRKRQEEMMEKMRADQERRMQEMRERTKLP